MSVVHWGLLLRLLRLQHYCLASMAARLSSTGISHHNLHPHIPLILLSAVNSSPHPEFDCFTISKLQLPAAAPSRGSMSLSGVCMAAARTVWFSFHLGCHRSAVSVSALNVSPLPQTIALTWGSVPPPAECRSSPTSTPVFLPSSFILPSSMWFCVLFSAGQVLLSALSWSSACTSMSEGVFLVYPWREMYSTSSYSSAILFLVSWLLYMLYINTYCITIVFALSSQLSTGANTVKESTVYVYLKLF